MSEKDMLEIEEIYLDSRRPLSLADVTFEELLGEMDDSEYERIVTAGIVSAMR